MEKSFFKSVGMNISSILEQKNITQQHLADLMGVSKQVLSKIIKGQKAINVSEIFMISKALDVPIDSLLDVGLQSRNPSPQFSFMGDLKKEKTKEKVDFLRNVIDELLFLEDYSNDCQ